MLADNRSGTPPRALSAAASGRRLPVLGAVVLLVLAGASRFIGLGALDPWQDEVLSFQTSSDLLPKLMSWVTPGNDVHSPLPFIEIKLVRAALGSSDVALRLPAAAYGVAGVLAFYLVVGRCVTWAIGFAGALLLALNPFVLEWSREARMYSHWLFYALLAIGVAYAAVQRGDRGARDALNWRWWLLGLLFMLLHASSVSAIMTIGAIGLWLGLVALSELMRRSGRGWTILGGAALATMVYLCSWGLTGLGKLMTTLGRDPAASPDHHAPVFVHEFIGALRDLTGSAPAPVAIVLWVAAIAGWGLLWRMGHWRLVLLVALVTFVPWLSYPSITKHHFFAGRYVYPGLIGLSVGLAAAGVWLWQWGAAAGARRGRIAAVAVMAAVIVFWAPVWRLLYTVPKMQVREALRPIWEHAESGDVVVVVPDWFACYESYYGFGEQAKLILGPAPTRFAGAEVDREDGPFWDDFDTLMPTDDQAAPPPGVWLFVVQHQGGETSMKSNLDRAEAVFRAYGLTDSGARAELEKMSDGKLTLTVRITREGIQHAVTTTGRAHRTPW